ncbi:MAG: ABC transporter permease [Theionarchaea archaeon]|nr:ABC transporter permease [Theionarchaea archaeon]
MNMREALSMSIHNIRQHTFRSVFTTLGVIIGIAAVISTITLVASINAYSIGQWEESMRTDLLTVIAGETEEQLVGEVINTTLLPIFTERDLSALEKIEHVVEVIPMAQVEYNMKKGIWHGETNLSGVSLLSTERSAFGENMLELETGSTFKTDGEAVVTEHVALMIDETAEDAVGETIYVALAEGEREFIIAGIIRGTEMFKNPTIFIPESYYTQGRDGKRVYDFLIVRVDSVKNIDAVEEKALTYLKTSDAQEYLEEDVPYLDVVIVSQKKLIDMILNQTSQFSKLLSSVGLTSLIVGCIGIINVMLVAVGERIREVGIMKALGARKRDILQLFLLESVIISLIGALIGAVTGICGGYALIAFFFSAKTPIVFQWSWFPIAIVAGLIAGVASGLYPAVKASRIHPVEALRYE